MTQRMTPGMPTLDSSRDDILAALYELFRRRGYDGVSISDISAETGLGKSSLYHHFPGGKEEMAAAVSDFAKANLKAGVLAALDGDRPLAVKVDEMLAATRRAYGGGEDPCFAAAMLLGAGPRATGASIIEGWIEALSQALQADGASKKAAGERASAALVEIQGGLIVSRATGDPGVFLRALKAARERLLSA